MYSNISTKRIMEEKKDKICDSKILSIIIPTYNMEKYIEKCLSSLVVPDIDKLDILVINDGSKDRTSEIAHNFAKQYPNSIKVIDKENGNYGSCVNRGLKEVKGKYVKILDADDSFNTLNFNKFVKEIENIDCDLIISDYVTVNKDYKVQFHWSPTKTPPRKQLSIDKIRDYLLDGGFQMHAVTYKTENLKRIGYNQLESIPYTDNQWMFLPMTIVQKVFYFDLPVYQYLIGRIGQTISSEAYVKNADAIMILVKQIINDYLNYRDCDRYLKHRLSVLIARAYYIFLFRKTDSNSNNQIILLDKMLEKTIPDIYNSIDNSKLLFLPFYYIRHWRNNNYNNNTKTYVFLRYLYNLIKLLKLK